MQDPVNSNTRSRLKVLFVTLTLGGKSGGGAEKVLINLANALDRNRFQAVIASLVRGNTYEAMVLRHVGVIKLDIQYAFFLPFALAGLIRRVRPDVVLTTLSAPNLIAGLIKSFYKTRVNIIAREINILSIITRKFTHKRIIDYLYTYFYRKLDKIVCQSQDMKNDLFENYNIQSEKLVVIHNPVDMDQIRRQTEAKSQLFGNDRINLLSVGRLAYQKGFDLMIKVLAKLDNNYVLTILGEGEERLRLESLAKALRVEKRICMPGFTLNPYAYMYAADLFILPSRYEGFPNVVLEANACGTPVVAFASPGGVNEIIVEGENGWLVPPGDIEGMARKITDVVMDESKRPAREQVRRSVVSRFDLPVIANRYEALFESVVKV